MKEKVTRRINIIKEVVELGKEFLVMMNNHYPGYAANILIRMMVLDDIIVSLNEYLRRAENVNWDDPEEADKFKEEFVDYGESIDIDNVFTTLDEVLGTDNEAPSEDVLENSADIIGRVAKKSALLAFYDQYNM